MRRKKERELKFRVRSTVTAVQSNECVGYSSVSQPPGRGPVPGPGINDTGPREFVILFF
jgi:hypothetical protein